MNNLATSNQRLESMLGNFIKMNTASTSGTGSLPSNTVANPKGELKAITTRSGLVLDEPSVPMPPPSYNILRKRMNAVGRTFTDRKLNCRDVLFPVEKFTFPADFVIVDYESDPRVPLILGRPFLRTARALIDVHGEEMILRDGNERLILNMRNDTSSYSNEPHQESINMIDVYNVSHEEIREDLFATNHPSGNPTSLVSTHTNLTSPEVNDDIFDPEEDIIENLLNLDKTKDLPLYHDNKLSGNPTPILELETKSSSSSPTLISLKERNDDLPFDAESDLLELEYLLNHDPIKDMDSILEDSVDENSLDDNLDDTISEMFTDEHALDYSSPPLWDDYDDNLFDHETVNDDTYDDPFDFKEEKIKDSKILIDELDSPESRFYPPLMNLPFPQKKFPWLGYSRSHPKMRKKFSTPGFSLLKEFKLLLSWNYLIGALKLSKSPKFLKARWKFFLALTKRTSESWMFRVSTSIPLDKLKNGGIGQPK
ncbi:reverse transcriptase domain-containing protein [Tanacetum coccineum]